MAYDLIFGDTRRDWSCGKLLVQPPDPRDPPWRARENADPAQLGEATRTEVAASAALALRLARAGRLPRADQEQFARFHRRWTDAYSTRRGKWRKQDVLPLWNFRQANTHLAARLKAFDVIAKTPAKAPPEAVAVGQKEERGIMAPGPKPISTKWALLAGAAAALLSVGMFKKAAGGFQHVT